MSHDDIDPYVEIRPSCNPIVAKHLKTKDLNGAGRNPTFGKVNGKYLASICKGNIKDDEDVKLSITVNVNKLTKPAFIGSCNGQYRTKFSDMTRFSTFNVLKILRLQQGKSLKQNKRYKKYLKIDVKLAKQQLGTITFQVKYKAVRQRQRFQRWANIQK